MTTQNNTQKEAPRWVQITAGIITLVLIALTMNWCMRGCDTSIPAEQAQILNADWDTLSYEQREQWITTWLDVNQNNYDNYDEIDNAIRQQFNFPATVEYDLRPSLSRGYTTNADSGWVFVNGTGTAQNAFGVPMQFSYQVRMIITPEVRKIDKVTVN